MPFFQVTFGDGTITVMQAHNKTMLREALREVKIIPIRRCKRCHKAPSEIQGTLCRPCYTEAEATSRSVWQDVPMSDQERENLIISYFVDS